MPEESVVLVEVATDFLWSFKNKNIGQFWRLGSENTRESSGMGGRAEEKG